MPKYIDPSKIRLTAVGTVDEDGDILVSVRDVRKAIDQTPAADVVPKSEVDKIFEELEQIPKDQPSYVLYVFLTKKIAELKKKYTGEQK